MGEGGWVGGRMADTEGENGGGRASIIISVEALLGTRDIIEAFPLSALRLTRTGGSARMTMDQDGD
jgi:hypothetical protein